MLENLLNSLVDLVLNAGIKILIAVLILIVGFRIIKIAEKLINTGKMLKNLDASVKSFLVSFCSIALKIILVITVAAYLGVPMTSMVTVLGSAAVAIGLALQGGLSNIAGGIMILVMRPFSVGDYVDCAGESGTVTSIGLMHTTLTTPDNVHIVIPNGNITSSTIENYSVEKKRRIDIDFSVAYNSDIDKVRNVMLKVANVTDGVLEDPAVEVYLVEHADSAVKFRLRVWCENANYWDVKFALMENVKRAFDASGIEIPYPQLDVRVENK